MGFWSKLFAGKEAESSKVIFVVEDNLFFGKLLAEFIKQRFPDLKEIEAFQTGESCLEALHKNPQVVLMDYFLVPTGEGKTGLDTIKEIKRQKPDTHIILLSAQTEIDVTIEAVKTYNCQYIKKDDNAMDKVAEAIRKVW